jgi:hypothetical protein
MTNRHEAAISYLSTLLSHPDIASQPIFMIHYGPSLIGSLLHIGDEHRAVEVGQSLLNLERRCDRTTAHNLLRGELEAFINDLDEVQQKQLASPELTDFVWSLALLHKRRSVRRQLPDRATYEQLGNILYMTHPPKEREWFASYTQDAA